MSIFSEQVGELDALGAGVAANCEPCFKYHYAQARLWGGSDEDMTAAVRTALKIKYSTSVTPAEISARRNISE